MVKRRDEVKAVLGSTVGKKNARTGEIELKRPMDNLKNILSKMGYQLTTTGGRVRVKGDQLHLYKMEDELITNRPDGSTDVLIDYERLKAEDKQRSLMQDISLIIHLLKHQKNWRMRVSLWIKMSLRVSL